ncbi:MAG: dephospho-CoA kinase [Acidobacteriaceae bacterium]
MLRAGLTGSLGSGKTTIAAIFREHGLHVLEADGIARSMMQRGEPVFRRIVEHFGRGVLCQDGTLDRPRLAALAFGEGRLNELNQIVHPPVVAEQERQTTGIFARDPRAIVVIESALIFEAEAWGTVPHWRERFDRIILVTAPEEINIQRFLTRILPADASLEQRDGAERDARARLAAQIPDAKKLSLADFIIDNSGSLEATRWQAERVAKELLTSASV